MKKVIIAIDSFKGSLTSLEAGNAVKKAIYDVDSKIQVHVYPLADGGEGMLEAWMFGSKGRIETIPVSGPAGNKIYASYGVIGNKAIIESASCCGLNLIEKNQRNPMNATTYGLGEMIWDAFEKGCREFVIGLGGSATNDGGLGMLQALGAVFLDEFGNKVGPYGRNLLKVRDINTDKINMRLQQCDFTIACDVDNPLCGKNGASAVFGPQKGADDETVRILDQALSHYSQIVEKAFCCETHNIKGAGAAGGLGFAFLTCFNTKLKPGIDLIIENLGLEKQISTADLVVTGEGSLDEQTIMGKAPFGIARLAKKYDCKVIAFCGKTDGNSKLNYAGIDAFFAIQQGPCSLKEALNKENAEKNLEATAKQVFHLIKTFEQNNETIDMKSEKGFAVNDFSDDFNGKGSSFF